MTFTKEQEAFIEQVAYRVGENIAKRIALDRLRDIEIHEARCDLKAVVTKVEKRIDRFFWTMVGVGIGAGAIGGGTSQLLRWLSGSG